MLGGLAAWRGCDDEHRISGLQHRVRLVLGAWVYFWHTQSWHFLGIPSALPASSQKPSCRSCQLEGAVAHGVVQHSEVVISIVVLHDGLPRLRGLRSQTARFPQH